MKGISSTLRVLVDPWDGTRPFLEGGRWVAAVLTLCLLTALAGGAVSSRWNAAPTVIAELREEGELSKTSEQELQELVSRKQRTRLVAGVANGVLGVPMRLGAHALVLALLAWLVGRSLPLGKAWQVSVLASLPTVLAQLGLLLVTLRQEAVEVRAVDMLLPSHLGAWIQAEGPRAAVYRAVDLFELWGVGLVGLGFGTATGMPRGRSLLLALLLFVLQVAVFQVGVPGLMAHGGGGR